MSVVIIILRLCNRCDDFDVGYETKTLKDSKNMVGANFLTVGGESIDIQDIVVTVDGETPGDGGYDMWWWEVDDVKGTAGYVYAQWHSPYWLDDGTEDLEVVGGAAWADPDSWYGFFPAGTVYPSDPTKKSTVDRTKKFAPGEGFWLKPNESGTPKVTISGKVVQSSSDNVTLTLKDSKNMVVNPFPTAIDIQDIKVYVDGVVPGDGGYDMWWWEVDDVKGTAGYVYAQWHSPYWLDDGTEDLEVVGGAAWADPDSWYGFFPAGTVYPSDPTKKSTVDRTKTFTSGEGFWLKPNESGTATVQFANPLK